MGWSRRRALLVPGSASMEHQACAVACANTLEAQGWSTRTLDAKWLPGLNRRAVTRACRAIPAVADLCDALYFAYLRADGRLADHSGAFARFMAPGLRQALDRYPADLILSISPRGASAVSAVADGYPNARHVVFCTDALPHRLWIHPDVDLYLVTSASAEPAVRRFEPDARVKVISPAVRPEFYRAPTQRAARLGLGIPETDRCVLLVGGSRGIGSLASIATTLAETGLRVLAVAGRNARLHRLLRVAAERQAGIRPFGFTDRMPELMAASDLVITSPGGTCTEARTVGRPLLLLDLVKGRGRDNLQHELSLGESAVTSKRPADVTRSALAYLRDVQPARNGPTRSLAEWEDDFRLALESITA